MNLTVLESSRVLVGAHGRLWRWRRGLVVLRRTVHDRWRRRRSAVHFERQSWRLLVIARRLLVINHLMVRVHLLASFAGRCDTGGSRIEQNRSGQVEPLQQKNKQTHKKLI